MLTLSSRSTTCLENNELGWFPSSSRPAGPSGKGTREQASPRQQALTPIVCVMCSFKKQLLLRVYTTTHQGCQFKESNAIFPSMTCSRRAHEMHTTSAGMGRQASRRFCAPRFLNIYSLTITIFPRLIKDEGWITG